MCKISKKSKNLYPHSKKPTNIIFKQYSCKNLILGNAPDIWETFLTIISIAEAGIQPTLHDETIRLHTGNTNRMSTKPTQNKQESWGSCCNAAITRTFVLKNQCLFKTPVITYKIRSICSHYCNDMTNNKTVFLVPPSWQVGWTFIELISIQNHNVWKGPPVHEQLGTLLDFFFKLPSISYGCRCARYQCSDEYSQDSPNRICENVHKETTTIGRF